MKPAVSQGELSDAKLREYAGETIFERGLAYAREGHAVLVTDEGDSSTWKVAGTQRYQIQLYFEDDTLSGDCTCPYAEEHAFCKHMVAAALGWRVRLGGEPLAASAKGRASAALDKSAQRAAAQAAKRDALQAFLLVQPARDLAQQLLSWAEQDRDLMAVLRAWQTEAKASDASNGWKEALTALLKNRHAFLDRNDCRRYAQRGAKAVELLQKLANSRPAVALDASAHALRQIFKVCDTADDSDGDIGSLMESIHEVMASALRAASLTGDAAERWLRTWFALQEEDPWRIWGAQTMLAAAGPAVSALYSARVARDWAGWLQRRASSTTPTQRVRGLPAIWTDDNDLNLERDRLRRRLLDDLHRQGDSAGVLEVLRSSIEGAHEHLELARHLDALGRQRESLQQLETASRAFPNDWRVEDALLQTYERDGCVEDALAIRRLKLERMPEHIGNYKAVLAAAAAGRD
ncbi:MAG: SWIM zinc finger family protein, partial [Burkholderiaceae bacterium]|nr:SWIM zinc finger family protein [Burkholderiaceae bacterium]